MSVRVAIIGAGIMGSDHARIIAEELPGAHLQVVCDAREDRARSVADALGASDVATDAMASITRRDVDAVLIASPDDTHAPLAIAAITASKPTLCEKPLAPTSQECLEVIAAELQAGLRLIQTGFMRRFDQSYMAMKAAFDEGTLGKAVMMHNFHRNMAAPDWFTGQMAISNSAPHEFDICRFVLGTEYVSMTAFQGQKTKSIAPVMMVLETVDGQLVSIEINNNASYGYDVRGELVGERGSVSLSTPVHASYDLARHSTQPYDADWRPRFAEAYRRQNRAWLNSIVTEHPDSSAANAWDGYCATRVAEAGMASLRTGARVDIARAEMPVLYAPEGQKTESVRGQDR